MMTIISTTKFQVSFHTSKTSTNTMRLIRHCKVKHLFNYLVIEGLIILHKKHDLKEAQFYLSSSHLSNWDQSYPNYGTPK